MRKNSIIIVSVFIAVLAGIAYLSSSSSKKEPVNTPSSTNDQMSTTDSAGSDVMESDKYVLYSSEKFESSNGNRRILYFYANWCPTCRPVDQELTNESQMLPEDVIVIRVNYNDSDTDSKEKALAQKYGITYQHTFVEIDSEGEAVQKWNGGGIETLLDKLSNQ